MIDGVAPTVTSVDNSSDNGTYAIGDVITLTVGFSEVVVVSGTPALQLETGSSDRYASYASGSGSNTLTFQYTVQNGDTSSDLDQISSTALVLNGGSIADAAGNPAILTLAAPGETGSLGANADLVIDGVAPTGGTINPTYTQEGGDEPFGIWISDYEDEMAWPKPALADIDGDGDLDLFIGRYGTTLFFRNTGSASDPAYTQEGGRTPFGITEVLYGANPAFADIDNDGDQDLFVGESFSDFIGLGTGKTTFFRNTGSASDPAYIQEGGDTPFGIPDLGDRSSSNPALADIDRDGDLDLFIGNQWGKTLFFRNTGSTSDPAYTQEGGNTPFGISDVGNFARLR